MKENFSYDIFEKTLNLIDKERYWWTVKKSSINLISMQIKLLSYHQINGILLASSQHGISQGCH